MYKIPVSFNEKIQQRIRNSTGQNNILLDKKQWSYLLRYYSMTDREFQVARLVCEGFNNEQIARHLKITNGTVKTHLRNIYRKIWVNNKVSMLLRFVNDTRDVISKRKVISDDHRSNDLSKRTIRHQNRYMQGQKK